MSNPLEIVSAVLVASLLSMSVPAAAESIDSANSGQKKFSESWSLQNPKNMVSQSRCGAMPDIKCCIANIKNCFEPQNLSKNTTVVFRIHVVGHEPTYTVTKNSGTPADEFYCEQAFWEALPFIEVGGATTNADCEFYANQVSKSDQVSSRKLYSEAHPEIRKKYVVIHVIPISVQLLTSIEREDLQSLKNLKAISINNLKSPLLSEFRKEWVAFLKTEEYLFIPRRDILKEADHLVKKYQSLFID
ncbi:MAG: hypothetical protein P4L53_05020 [Candidatus Obscuribacterales bacterium]|nr:hypothetical protein [Candidatus Obscuribacterales bacterium]